MDLFDSIQKLVSDNEQNKNTENTKNTEIENPKQEVHNQEDAIAKNKITTNDREDSTSNTIKEEIQENNNLQVVEAQEQSIERKATENHEVDKHINALRRQRSSYDVLSMEPDTNSYLLYKCSQGGRSNVPLTNVLPVITKRNIYTNGTDEEVKYELTGYVLDDNDKKLGPIEITDKELSKLTNTLNNRFIGQVINFEANSDKKMREVVEIIGRESVETINTYTHTGFIEDNGNKYFLYQDGNIGIEKNTQIKTDLTDYNIQQYSFTEKEFDLKTALETEYSLLTLADNEIMIPLIATVFLSPMFSILQNAGIFMNYVLMVVGKTGTYKSTISALMLSHFGNFEVDTLPLSFRATFAGIEKVAFAAKDVLLVIDDYKPEALETAQEKTMEAILGLWGDRNQRIKMNSTGGLHRKYAPRGLAIVTGERLPHFSQSRLARAITIYTKEGSINFYKLKEIHEKKEQLSFVMKEFIKWVILKEQYIVDKALQLQKQYSLKSEQLHLHARIKQNITVLMIGFTFWLDFLFENKIINSNTKENLQETAYQVLKEVGENQQSDVEDENPVTVFFKTISQLQIAGKVYLEDYKTGKAIDIANGTHIGYVDNENNQYYLIADTVYKEVEKNCIGRFIVTPKQLQKSLADEGYIVTDKENRKVLRRTDPITKNKVEVLIMPKQKWNEAMHGNE